MLALFYCIWVQAKSMRMIRVYWCHICKSLISYDVVHMIHLIKVIVIDRIFSSYLCLLLCCGIKQFMSVIF